MKKLIYISSFALVGLYFTACKTEPVGPSQAELDAQVEAKVQSVKDQLKADCDARLLQAAQAKADSIAAKTARKAAPAPVAAPKAVPQKPKATPPPKATPAPPKPQTIGNGKPKMGSQSSTTVGSGKPKMGATKDASGKVDDTKIGNGKPKMGGGN
ncbi:MAG: hypothetical protein R2831_04225 [Chitinophagaceae bacterium]